MPKVGRKREEESQLDRGRRRIGRGRREKDREREGSGRMRISECARKDNLSCVSVGRGRGRNRVVNLLGAWTFQSCRARRTKMSRAEEKSSHRADSTAMRASRVSRARRLSDRVRRLAGFGWEYRIYRLSDPAAAAPSYGRPSCCWVGGNIRFLHALALFPLRQQLCPH